MLKTLVVGAAAALLMTSNAVADGMPRRAAKASVVCCEPNWTGFYIGVGVGGAFVQHEHSANFVREWKNTETSVSEVFHLWDLENGRSHAFGTVTLGYDHQFGARWVGGVFVDYDFGNGKSDSRLRESIWFDHARLSDENNHAWSIGARLGILSSPSTLLYLSTGWTRISLDRDVSILDWNGIEHRRSFDKDLNGWFVGAGMETQLGWLHSGLTLRGEYRFTRLGDDHRTHTLFSESVCESACSTYTERLDLDHDVDVHSFRVVLAYKFGHRQAVAPLK